MVHALGHAAQGDGRIARHALFAAQADLLVLPSHEGHRGDLHLMDHLPRLPAQRKQLQIPGDPPDIAPDAPVHLRAVAGAQLLRIAPAEHALADVPRPGREPRPDAQRHAEQQHPGDAGIIPDGLADRQQRPQGVGHDVHPRVGSAEFLQRRADMGLPLLCAVPAEILHRAAMPRQEDAVTRPVPGKGGDIFIEKTRRGIDAMHEKHRRFRAGDDALPFAMQGQFSFPFLHYRPSPQPAR